MGFIQVRTQPVATAGVPFVCEIFIVRAAPGDLVTVRLAQTAGVRPFYSRTVDVPITIDGGGYAAFDDVVLHGPDSEARLVADDIASATPLACGDAHIGVVR